MLDVARVAQSTTCVGSKQHVSKATMDIYRTTEYHMMSLDQPTTYNAQHQHAACNMQNNSDYHKPIRPAQHQRTLAASADLNERRMF
jgi:hypothetical protein